MSHFLMDLKDQNPGPGLNKVFCKTPQRNLTQSVSVTLLYPVYVQIVIDNLKVIIWHCISASALMWTRIWI